MLRRALAIALVIAFGSPLVAPLFAATSDPEVSLPACCRSHGKHHCAMLHMMLAAQHGPALETAPCPMYPAPATKAVRHENAYAGGIGFLAAAQQPDPAPTIAELYPALKQDFPANPKRGPPSLAGTVIPRL